MFKPTELFKKTLIATLLIFLAFTAFMGFVFTSMGTEGIERYNSYLEDSYIGEEK